MSNSFTECVVNSEKDAFDLSSIFCPVMKRSCSSDCAWCVKTDTGYMCAIAHIAINLNCIEAYMRK